MVRDGRAISHSLVSREDHACFAVLGLLKMREFLNSKFIRMVRVFLYIVSRV
jgi:hypothetical protein